MVRWFLRVALPPLVALVAILLLWEAAVKVFKIEPYLLPTPRAIASAMIKHREVLLRSTWLTAKAALAGFALSAALGVAAAILLSTSRWVERSLYPFAIVFQTVPLVAIAPILTIGLGYGLKPVVAAACIVSVFPVIANTLTGLRSVDPALIDMFRLYGAGPMSRMLKLMVPSALPSIFTGLRIAAGLSVIGTIVSELTASFAGDDAGLGIQVIVNIRQFNGDVAFGAIVMATALGLTLFGIINIAGYLLLRRWHASAQERG